MKRIILKKQQLNEYIERKKSENIFYEIIDKLYENNKMLSETISKTSVNQNIINDYKRKNLINPYVYEMLIKNRIINEKHKII